MRTRDFQSNSLTRRLHDTIIQKLQNKEDITESEFNQATYDVRSLCALITRAPGKLQPVILSRICPELKQAIILNITNIEKILLALHFLNVELFIEEIIGINTFVINYSNADKLDFLLDMMSSKADITNLLINLTSKHLTYYMKDNVFENHFLIHIRESERFALITKHCSKQSLKEYASTPENLSRLLSILPGSDQIKMLQHLYNQNELHDFTKSNYYHFIKKQLTDSTTKNTFKQLVFSDGELLEREQLRTIKKTIITTNWSSYFSKNFESTQLGKHTVIVPSRIAKHAEIIQSVKSNKTSCNEALTSIRKSTEDYCNQQQKPSYFARIKSFVTPSNPEDQYFKSLSSSIMKITNSG